MHSSTMGNKKMVVEHFPLLSSVEGLSTPTTVGHILISFQPLWMHWEGQKHGLGV